MSVLIKGMEIPERCGQCFLRVGNCKQRMYMERRPKDCPLVEVKEPHGRLIDADALMEKAPELYEYLLVLAPTVIGAEGSDE